MVVADNFWEKKVLSNFDEINKIKKKLNQLNDSNVAFNYPYSEMIYDKKKGLWENKYYQTKKELEWWKNTWKNIKETENELDLVDKDQVVSKIEDSEKKAMKNQAHSWLKEIVDSTNEESGKRNNYDSSVNRKKNSNYHQRGHYFVFYEDGTKEHWLALYPMFDDNQVSDGHSHDSFIPKFSKPVKKFIDVYTCIGCGAASQGFTSLHNGYDSSSSDSWENIHKNLPFEPWFTELNNTKIRGSKVMSNSNKYCLGDVQDVWEGFTIEDKENKTFDKMYGYIPYGGTIQWRLARDVKKESDWTNRKISYQADKLWEKDEFTSYKDKNIYQQKMMDMTIDFILSEEKFVIDYFKSNNNIDDINSQLEQEVKRKFWKLINTKRKAYLFLENCANRMLNISHNDLQNEVKACNDEFLNLFLQKEPQVIREIWIKQVGKFIKEEKEEKIGSFYTNMLYKLENIKEDLRAQNEQVLID
ncbi:MAG: hypothetical protein AM1032_000328 [Mycoplasmataceae bacterium]|nr:MAG: hypothetical protein AM1032_000328 [Mycoplasmataceae bacterium]